MQELDVVIFGQYAAEYSKALDNASRRGITGIGKALFIELFQEARTEVFTNRLSEVVSAQLASIRTTLMQFSKIFLSLK